MGPNQPFTIKFNRERLAFAANLILVIVISGLFQNHGINAANSFIPPENIDQELLLTQEEKNAFDQFKANVWSNITDDWKDYLKQDLFILRWIRAKDLDVDRATNDMFQFISFLNKNHLQNITKEDFQDLYPDFPFHFTYDHEGRPVGYGSPGEGWNIRRGILQGKRARIIRYTYKITFEALDRVIEVNKKKPNVTQFLVLLNMEVTMGFNVFQHSCSACISSYLNLLDIYERFLPGYAKEVIVINAPQAYLLLLEILRPALSPYTRKTLKVFGANRNNWKPYLDARISENMLPPEYGGTMK